MAKKPVESNLNEMVPLFVPADLDSGIEDGQYVGCNGRRYLIKKGETVMVPRFVYNIVMASMTCDIATARKIAALEQAAANAK